MLQPNQRCDFKTYDGHGEVRHLLLNLHGDLQKKNLKFRINHVLQSFAF